MEQDAPELWENAACFRIDLLTEFVFISREREEKYSELTSNFFL